MGGFAQMPRPLGYKQRSEVRRVVRLWGAGVRGRVGHFSPMFAEDLEAGLPGKTEAQAGHLRGDSTVCSHPLGPDSVYPATCV